MSSVTLTVRDLIEICEFMGQPERCFDHWLEYMDEGGMEEEVTIHQSHKGIAILDDDGVEERYNIALTCDGCDANEVQPIGDPMPLSKEKLAGLINKHGIFGEKSNV